MITVILGHIIRLLNVLDMHYNVYRVILEDSNLLLYNVSGLPLKAARLNRVNKSCDLNRPVPGGWKCPIRKEAGARGLFLTGGPF